MALRTLTRKIQMDILRCDEDICGLIFAQRRAQHACRLLLDALKAHNGLTRKEMSRFAWDLNRGKVEPGFRYTRSRFYSQIRRTLLTLGLLSIEDRFVACREIEFMPERRKQRDIIAKYVPVRQPISRRPPDGLNLVRLTWIVCKKWNDEFLIQGGV